MKRLALLCSLALAVPLIASATASSAPRDTLPLSSIDPTGVAGSAPDITKFALTYGTPETVHPTEIPPTLKSFQLPAKALVAHAGKLLRIPTVTVLLSDGSVVPPDSQTCTLKYESRRISPLAGGCTWNIPTAYRNAHLVLTVTVNYAGRTASKTVTLLVH
jgi:hypothetical protein